MLRKMQGQVYEYITPKDLQTIYKFMEDNVDQLEAEYKELNPEDYEETPLESKKYIDWAKERSIDLMQKLYDEFLSD